MFDEQILTILQSAGIPAADAYVCIKAIKKKKADKVASFRQRFEEGFVKRLQEAEGATEEVAKDVVDKIWTIVNDAASYMFCAAHAFSMACDSLYAAYLKAHYPYEFYTAMLKLYDEKGNKDKIAAIIAEMKRYKGIRLTPGRFGQDNRDWLIDKENRSISQSLSAIKYVSKKAAEDLFTVGQDVYFSFTDVLRTLQMDTCLDTRQIGVLTSIGYFNSFGGNKMLTDFSREYFEGKNKLTKTLVPKSVEKRLAVNRELEATMPDEKLPIAQQLAFESEYIGLCLTEEPDAPPNQFYVLEIDDKFGVKAKLYSVQRGTSGIMRLRKDSYQQNPFSAGDCIMVERGENRPRYTYVNGTRKPTGEKDFWITGYTCQSKKDDV